MTEIKATIILPTTGDRGPILPYSVGAILRQTLTNFQLFIIGDGVTEETRQIIHRLQAEDERVHFFDRPKHKRRGEVYRHEALREAKGEIVAYCCDRDLWLPSHLGRLFELLQTHELVATNFYKIRTDQGIQFGEPPFYGEAPDQPKDVVQAGAFVLSSVGHRLDFYRSLPYGWRTTPDGIFTDRYMWQQFLARPDCRCMIDYRPTFLYFKRGHYPGWPLDKRLPELEQWSITITDQTRWETKRKKALAELLEERLALRKSLQKTILIKGLIPSKWLRRASGKLANGPKRLLARLRS